MYGTAQKSPEAFRTISEVADELDVPQHVLRFWETRFVAVKPMKRGGGRRYYRPEDVDLLRGIRTLLYSDGLTIKGVQKVLREHGARYVLELGKKAGSHFENLRGEFDAFKAEAESIPSNVHLFPKTSAHALPRERTLAEEWEEVMAGPRRLTGAERAHFQNLLDELLELKARLRAARRKPGF